MTLRPYQKDTIDQLYDWMRRNNGNPCVYLPTGSGKSIIVAALCQNALQSWPETRILMLTTQRELIAQNAEKMRAIWPNAPLGIFAAGLRRKEIDAITFGSIQSLRGKADLLGHINLIIYDESHTISHKDEGTARNLITALHEINPSLRVIGLTGSPWRLGHGSIAEGEALFDGMIEPISIEALQYQGYLCRLKSKLTKHQISTEGVHKRGGEYIEKELQAKVDTADNNQSVVMEIIRKAEEYDRKHWIIFCTGIDHAEHICTLLQDNGINAAALSGKTPASERDRIITGYKSGEIKAVVNVNVLSTGFDSPDTDLIAMLRPTMSPVIYVQQVGRGLRLKSHTDYCLVLDFVGNISQHGPITHVTPPRKKGEGDGIAPAKLCPECDEMLHTSVMVCHECGYKFPETTKEDMQLRVSDDIQGDGSISLPCTGWQWEKYTSRKSGKEMVRVTYYSGLVDYISEYYCIWHDGFAGRKGWQKMTETVEKSGGLMLNDFEKFLTHMNMTPPPSEIAYKKNGRYKEIIDKIWNEKIEEDEIPF